MKKAACKNSLLGKNSHTEVLSALEFEPSKKAVLYAIR